MKSKPKKPKAKQAAKDSMRNRPIHIPLSFDAAVEGLLNVKNKKKSGADQPPK